MEADNQPVKNDSAMKVLEEELKIYELNKTKFEKEHKWEWVVYMERKLLGSMKISKMRRGRQWRNLVAART